MRYRLRAASIVLMLGSLPVLAGGAPPAYANHDQGDPNIRVRLLAFDNVPTIAFSPGGLRVTGIGGTPAAVLVSQTGVNVFDVHTGPGCGGPWSLAAGGVGGPVDVQAGGGGEANLVQACEPGGGRAYRGFLRATRDSEGPQRTVNVVNIEDYLKGVVPRESPASWGDLNGGVGMHALRAQAVAARSYSASEHRYSYADTCDSTACQVYKGYVFNGAVLEDPRTNRAIAETAREVRRGSGVKRTEFSSSTGGHTAGGEFPAVGDDGDDVSSNPNHRWTAGIAVGVIQGAYPEVGSLTGVQVTARNGLGEWGGRVTQVVISGTAASKTVSGNDFRSRFGLKSDWFTVTDGTGGDGNVDLLGAGWGHGRGMGQYGALGYALDDGWDYRRILDHFYGATVAGFLPGGGVQGYWVLDRVGGIFTFGNAQFHGSLPQLTAQGVSVGRAEIMDVEPTPSGNGYWVLDKAGGIFSFGDARFFGSVPQLREQGIKIGPANVIDLAATPSGNGYWLLDSVGGMFSFGDAQFYGSVPALRNAGVSIGRADVVRMTPTGSGGGYVMIDDQGGVFAFGDGQFFGSLPGLRNQGVRIGSAPVVGIAATGAGYWMLDQRGGVFAFGNAPFQGSLPGAGINATAAGIASTKTGNGYHIVTADNGEVHPFGDAPDFGGIPDTGVKTTGRGIAPRYET